MGSFTSAGDFGIAKGLDRTSGLARTRAGTAIYMAPEIHGGDKYNTVADLWPLGKPFHGYDWLQAISKE